MQLTLNDIWRLDLTWHDHWNLLNIDLRNIYFHNSTHWSEFYFQVWIPLWLWKILRFTVFRLLVKLSHPSNDFIINPAPCRTSPICFFTEISHPSILKSFFSKSTLLYFGRRHYAIAYPQNNIGVWCSLNVCYEVD